MTTENEKKQTTTFKNYLQKIDHFIERSPMKGFFEDMDSFFHKHNVFNSFPVDLYETDTELVIKAELPGIKKEQIFIDVQGTEVKITVKTDVLTEETTEAASFHRRERSYSYSERTIKVPYIITKTGTKASFENGMLELRSPKQPFEQQIIDIQ